MPAERFFIEKPLTSDLEVILEGQEFHHLAHVMRLEEGEITEVVNGQGVLAQAVLIRKEKKQAIFLIQSIEEKKKNTREIILAQAIPRINRLDFIIEKGTELNVTQFWLFPGEHSERKSLTDHQVERLKGLSIAAMKQCGRLFLPSLEIKAPLDKWKELPSKSYFGDVEENAPPLSQIHKVQESALIFIGPEAGFSENEIKKLLSLGAQGVKLHANTLRTDTAALVALTLLS